METSNESKNMVANLHSSISKCQGIFFLFYCRGTKALSICMTVFIVTTTCMCILYFNKCGELWIAKNLQKYEILLRLKREKEEGNEQMFRKKPAFKVRTND